MKAVVKFKFQDKEGFLSVVEKSNVYYTLVQKDTPKVLEAEKHKKLLISFDLKQPQYKEVVVQVIYEKDLIKWVFDALAADNNLYFKQLDDTLCVLAINK